MTFIATISVTRKQPEHGCVFLAPTYEQATAELAAFCRSDWSESVELPEDDDEAIFMYCDRHDCHAVIEGIPDEVIKAMATNPATFQVWNSYDYHSKEAAA